MSLVKSFGVFCAFGVLCIALQAHAAEGDVAAGEKLYKASCMSCHKEKPGKMAGKPVADLVAKTKKYKTMACPTGKVATMQQAIKGLSDQQITDIAVYLNSMK